MSKRFLVTYVDHAKICENPCEAMVREKFSIANNVQIFLQYFDKDFDSFVDCDWMELDHLSSNKLKICEVKRNEYRYSISDISADISSAESDISSASTIIIPTIELENTEIDNSDFSPAQILNLDNNEYNQELHNADDDKQKFKDSQKLNSENTLHHGTSKNLGETDHMNLQYKLPEIKPESTLGRNLRAKTVLSNKNKSIFLNLIYESFSSQGIYNIGHRYKEIATTILTKYPHLSMGFEFNDAKKLWIKALYAKFGNSKRRDDKDEEEVVKRKQRKVDWKALNTSFDSWWSIPNYKPKDKTEDDEDPTLLDSYKFWLQKEYQKSAKNEAAMSLKMDLTFEDRRRLLFAQDNHSSLSSISLLKEYPCLRFENQCLLEVKRLFGGTDYASTSLKAQIHQFAFKVNDLVSTSRSQNKNYVLNIPSMTNAHKLEEVILYRLTGNVALFLSDDPRMVLRNSVDEMKTPFLLNSGDSFSICVDGEVYISEISAEISTFFGVACFYIFNIEVPKCIRRTFELLQYIFFNICSKKFRPTQAQGKLNIVWKDGQAGTE